MDFFIWGVENPDREEERIVILMTLSESEQIIEYQMIPSSDWSLKSSFSRFLFFIKPTDVLQLKRKRKKERKKEDL